MSALTSTLSIEISKDDASNSNQTNSPSSASLLQSMTANTDVEADDETYASTIEPPVQCHNEPSIMGTDLSHLVVNHSDEDEEVEDEFFQSKILPSCTFPITVHLLLYIYL